VPNVGDDKNTTTIVLGTTGRKWAVFFTPTKKHLSADQRLAAATESHRWANFSDLDPRISHR
jgi:hypothetical protein